MTTRLIFSGVFVLLGLLHLVSQVVLDADLVDDTYIFLRYADNFSNGQGLVFNEGERVEGFSSLLWVVGLGLAGWLQLDLVLTSKVVGSFFGIATALGLVVFSRRYLPGPATVAALVAAGFLVTNPSFEYWVWSGMDIAVFTFLFFLSFVVFLIQVKTAGTMGLAGGCFALAVLARLDMLALAPVYLFFVYWWNRNEKGALWRKYGSFLAPLGLVALSFLWRYDYYGSMLPNTYYVKVDVPSEVLVDRGLSYAAAFAQAYWPLLLGVLLGIIALLILRVGLPIEASFSLAVVGFWSLYVVYVGGDHFGSFRFFVPVLPVLALLFAGILGQLAGRLRWGEGWRYAGVALAAVGLLAATNYWSHEFQFEGLRARANVELTRNWATVGQWLKKNVPAEATVGSVVVGAIPYYSELRTYDLLGLTDRAIATKGGVNVYAEIGHQKYDTDYVLSKKPDFIIYNSSGQYTYPIHEDASRITTRYAFALYDLATDERARGMYEYRAIEMENGRYVELLELKGSRVVAEFNERVK